MTREQALDAWRHRPMVVTVLERCDECETLKPDVAKRTNYWPYVAIKSCGQCFSRLVAEASGVAAC